MNEPGCQEKSTIHIYSVEEKKDLYIETQNINIEWLYTGQPVAVFTDPGTGKQIRAIFTTVEDQNELIGKKFSNVEITNELLLQKKTEYMKIGILHEIETIWKDYFNAEDQRLHLEKNMLEEFETKMEACKKDADQQIENARKLFKQIEHEYENTMSKVKPFLK